MVPSAAPTPPSAPRWTAAPLDARLQVVTGKGGTGKTTVAVTLARALAAQGRRVLVAEVEQRGALAPVIGCSPLDEHERLVHEDPSGGTLHATSLDARAALGEYLSVHYRLGPARAVLDQVGAVELATSIAPGLADVLVTGKLYEASRRGPAHQRRAGSPEGYDHVVVDAPPTGRVVRFLDANRHVADLAKVGPVRAQADTVAAWLHSAQTVVHLVTLLEEMPVAETVEAVAELRAAGLVPGLLVVDQVHDDHLAEEDLAGFDAAVTGEVTAEEIAATLAGAGVVEPAATAASLLATARRHADRLAVEGEQQSLLDALGLPTILLPHLVEGVGLRGLATLVATLTAQVGEPV